MSVKVFKTIDEQIEILETRGLIISNKAQAKEFLLHHNYYRISGYTLTLRKNDVFYKSVTFENIMEIYNFDFELRTILLKYLQLIEINIKSIYAYYFCKLYDCKVYTDATLFSNMEQHTKTLQNVSSQKLKSLKQEAFLKHYNEINEEIIPLWAYIEIFTFSNISIFYSISPPELKNKVANSLGICINKSGKILESLLHDLTILRNLCAHAGRLYNRLFEHKPSLNKAEKKLLIEKSDGTIDNSRLYGFILILKRLLSKSDFDNLRTFLIELNKKYPFVNMKYYGFREDWKEQV